MKICRTLVGILIPSLFLWGGFCPAQQAIDSPAPSYVVRLYTSEDNLEQGKESNYAVEVLNNSDAAISLSSEAISEVYSVTAAVKTGGPKEAAATQPLGGGPAKECANRVTIRVGITGDSVPKYPPEVEYHGAIWMLRIEPHGRLFLPIVLQAGSLQPGSVKLSAAIFLNGVGTVESSERQMEVVFPRK